MKFGAAFEKQHSASVAALMEDIANDMVSSGLLTGSSSQAYQSYILVADYIFIHLIIINIIEGIKEE